MVKKKKLPLVIVEWKDHHSNEKWSEPHQVDNKPMFCLSVGWLMREDDDGLTLVTCVDPVDFAEGTVGGTTYIIKSCITKFQVVRKGSK